MMNWILSDELTDSDLSLTLAELGRADGDTVVSFLLSYSISDSHIVRDGAAEGLLRHIA